MCWGYSSIFSSGLPQSTYAFSNTWPEKFASTHQIFLKSEEGLAIPQIMISITFKLTNRVVESKHVFKASERYKTFWIQFNYNGEFFPGISEERKPSGMSYSHPKQCQEVSRIVQLWLAEYMLTEGKSVHWGKLLGEHNTLLITTGLYVDVPILISEPCEDHRPAQSQTENVCVLERLHLPHDSSQGKVCLPEKEQGC